MPMISTHINTKITDDQELKLKTEFGKAISILSGKSENWLMLSFEENAHLWFKGDNSKKIAWVEVKVYGKIDYSQSSKLTAEICKILEDVMSVDGNNVYVKYEEIEMWGYNGSNF